MIPSVGTVAKPKRKTAYNVVKHDCGNGLMLTTRQIAARLGCSVNTVRARVMRGWKGSDLLLPTAERRKPGNPRVTTQIVAFKIAREFPDHVPSTNQIMKLHPMSRTAAGYWRNAVLRATRELDNE